MAIYKSVRVLALSTSTIDYDSSNILNEKHEPQWGVPSKHQLVHLHTYVVTQAGTASPL
jgi:hypothetical protein